MLHVFCLADYRFQHNHPVTSDTSLIAQGDELITTCAYNTLDRTNVTTAGEGTEQEVSSEQLGGSILQLDIQTLHQLAPLGTSLIGACVCAHVCRCALHSFSTGLA